MNADMTAHVELPAVKEEARHSIPLNNRQEQSEMRLCDAQHSSCLWPAQEKVSVDHQWATQNGDSSFGSQDHAKSHFLQQAGQQCSVSNLKKRLMDRERQRRHRERIRADPERREAYRERERLRYQRRKSMISALPEQVTTEPQSRGLSDIIEREQRPTMEDHCHPKNYAFLNVSQNPHTDTGNMADMMINRPAVETDVVDMRRQAKDMNPVSCLLSVTEKEAQEHFFSTQHRGERFMDRERQRRYRERIRSDPLKQSDDEKERRRFMDRERQRRRREKMRTDRDKQQAHAKRERQRLLDRERQRRCRQRLQADPVRWQAYLEKERHRSREAARRNRAKKSLAKALTGWISEWGQDGS